jgi:hypothetical protein
VINVKSRSSSRWSRSGLPEIRVIVMRVPTGRRGSSGAGQSVSGIVILGDVMARLKKAPPWAGVSDSRHEYLVRMVMGRLGNGETVCLSVAMSFRGG